MRHCFLIASGQGHLRWEEAFGTVQIVHAPAAALAATTSDDLIWVDATRIDWLQVLRAAPSAPRVIAISLMPGREEAMAVLSAGARGYCHALAAPQMLRQVALVVTNGGLWVGPDLMQQTAEALARVIQPQSQTKSDDPLARLTPRERDVALIVAGGAANKEVARRLDITPRTVKAHMSAIFEKLQVRDRLQLVVLLRRAGVSLPA